MTKTERVALTLPGGTEIRGTRAQSSQFSDGPLPIILGDDGGRYTVLREDSVRALKKCPYSGYEY